MGEIVRKIRKQVIDEFRALPDKAWVVNDHLLVVEKFAKQFCGLYPKADQEAVMLGVWLHDIGRARKRTPDHDLHGAQEAKKVLSQSNLPKKKIDLVYEICRAHRCQRIKPQSLEAKILAAADAMSHLVNSFYILLIFKKHWGNDFEENKRKALIKLERDFDNKILLPEVKKMARPLYKAWKKILTS